jgi:hypothetical protein
MLERKGVSFLPILCSGKYGHRRNKHLSPIESGLNPKVIERVRVTLVPMPKTARVDFA